MLYSYISISAMDIFIPFQGRGGSASNPDLLISIFCIVIGLMQAGFIIPLYCLCKRPLLILCGYILIFVIFVIIMFTPVGFPYREAVSAQRFWIFVSVFLKLFNLIFMYLFISHIIFQ